MERRKRKGTGGEWEESEEGREEDGPLTQIPG